jgi:hypothetical protein
MLTPQQLDRTQALLRQRWDTLGIEDVFQSLTDEYHDAVVVEETIGDAIVERVHQAYQQAGLLSGE